MFESFAHQRTLFMFFFFSVLTTILFSFLILFLFTGVLCMIYHNVERRKEMKRLEKEYGLSERRCDRRPCICLHSSVSNQTGANAVLLLLYIFFAAFLYCCVRQQQQRWRRHRRQRWRRRQRQRQRRLLLLLTGWLAGCLLLVCCCYVCAWICLFWILVFACGYVCIVLRCQRTACRRRRRHA